MSRPEVHIVGIRQHTFKLFPTTNYLLDRTYTIYYWTQDATMDVNQSLSSCSRHAALHLHLRGDAIVLKHRQSGPHRFEDVTMEDINVVRSLIGR